MIFMKVEEKYVHIYRKFLEIFGAQQGNSS